MTNEAGTEAEAASADERRTINSALRRYQVMAVITGCMLLLLCTELILKYVVHVNGTAPVIGSWVAIVHGWIYVIYVIFAFMLWSNAQWKLGRLAVLAVAGVIPLLSFVMEWQATRWVRREYPAPQ